MSALFLIIGYLLIALAFIVSLGTTIYLWGPESYNLSLAAWTGFKLWVTMIISGLIALSIAFLSA